MSEQKMSAPKATASAKKKVNGVYVDATDPKPGGAGAQQSGGSAGGGGKKKGVLAIESGTPPKCKMPRCSQSPEDPSGGKTKMLINWGPKNTLVTHFALEACFAKTEKEKKSEWKPVSSIQKKDFAVLDFAYPNTWWLRARARCAFSDRNSHARMPLVPTPLLRLKRAGM
jgi:hypothetical protein